MSQMHMNLWQAIKNIFSPPPPSAEDAGHEDLFRIRYQAFRRLLSANNAALDIMTELEEALREKRHFGMHFIRSRSTAVTAKVFAIVENLLFLAPDKYTPLRTVLRDIQGHVQNSLAPQHAPRREAFILDLDHITALDAPDVGGKMANLGELRNRLLTPVPDGFAITAHAYAQFMDQSGLFEAINCLVLGHPMATYFGLAPATTNDQGLANAADFALAEKDNQPLGLLELCAKIQSMILSTPLLPELKDAILSAYDHLCEREGSPVRVALRSSALGEDSVGASFAGQHKSLLGLDRGSLLDGYKEVLASKYSAHAMAYRYMLGIRDDEVLMCVGCLSMVTSKTGGVVYTASPLAEDEHIRITSTWGMAKGVVDGTTTTDQFTVTKDMPSRIISRSVPCKDVALVCSETEGVCRTSVEAHLCAQATLSDAQILELTDLAQRIEDHYHSPQDIEWAYTPASTLMILQTRPLEIRQSQQPKDAKAEPDQPPILQGGQTASSGTASGVVHVLRKDVDMLLLPKHPILVCAQATPKWATVLNRCQGLITEQGSVAGHLANVAREFNIPALFGLPEASSRLAAGQEITLDADNRAIYPGVQQALLDRQPERLGMLTGSPVFQTLQRVCSHITPLHLLDPDGLDFTPTGCRSLHDITRFCHEKAVLEMFHFGRDHAFSPRSSKQLKTQIPMQWWIINLEDGFHTETGEKMVSLANIASVPMLALWRGIVAYPWDGPPDIDGKGFLSVLFQATANRNLEPALASPFADKNYFMISRHFCNLQSRFGFHFTSVEALAGPRSRENYIRFQFKGGAADLPRKIRRARFVGEILDEFGFQTKIREDALLARLDDCDQTFMEKRLEILGHILIHTRQLDMVMSREETVLFYKERILRQLHTLINTQTGKDT